MLIERFFRIVIFLADIPGEGGGRLQRRMHELLGLLELEESADQPIRSYSHGMRKKVALAASLLHDPHVILFDEPTSGLDPRSARVVKDLLLGLRDRGTTVFLSTHILEVAGRMCDRFRHRVCTGCRDLTRRRSGTSVGRGLIAAGGRCLPWHLFMPCTQASLQLDGITRKS